MSRGGFYYYFLKLAGLIFFALGIQALIMAIFYPGEIQSDHPLTTGDRILFVVMIGLGCGLAVFAGWRAARVVIENDALIVVRNGTNTHVPWVGVSGIKKLPFTTPPFYWIGFEKEPGVVVIPWSWFVVSIGLWSWDFSKFPNEIESRIALAWKDEKRT